MDLTPDPLVERLSRAVRAQLAAASADRAGADRAGAGVDEARALREISTRTFEAPVAAGGLDLGLTCGLVVCVELGRQALREVYGGGALLLDAFAAADRGDAAQRLVADDPPVATGGLDRFPGRPAVRAVPAGRDWLLVGDVAVEDVADPAADCCLVVEVGGEAALAVLPAEVWRPLARPDPGGARRLSLDRTPGGDVVGRLCTADVRFGPDGLISRARVRQAGYLLGLAAGAQQLAVRHAGTRTQFDRPIIQFQAVAFPLARSAISLAAARLSAYRAAWLADAGEPFAAAAVESLALAAETALATIRHAIQVHGARGLSREAPVHAFYLAVRRAATRLGDPGRLWREAGARRLAAARPAGSEDCDRSDRTSTTRGDDDAATGDHTGADAAGPDRPVPRGALPVR